MYSTLNWKSIVTSLLVVVKINSYFVKMNHISYQYWNMFRRENKSIFFVNTIKIWITAIPINVFKLKDMKYQQQCHLLLLLYNPFYVVIIQQIIECIINIKLPSYLKRTYLCIVHRNFMKRHKINFSPP